MGAYVRSTCPYCGVGCGVLATPDGTGGAAIAGDPSHPANHGKLCVKGSALGETLGLEGRLLHPMIRGQQATWSQAIGFVADGLRRVIGEHGPDSVAFYLSGQLLTEDYYIANKFAKGWLGTPHVDTNSRLCMASSVAGHRRAFGSDTVPQSYADLDEADLIILVGSNAAWCHTRAVPADAGEPREAGREDRQYRSPPHRHERRGGPAALHQAGHGQRALLVAAGAAACALRGRLRFRRDACDRLRRGLVRGAADRARHRDRGRADRPVPDDIATFVRWFIIRDKVVTCYSQGVNQSAQGSDKVNAILNCHLASARIGRPGCGPLSLTGQPNAMGGREVGGLANMLAAHMGYSPSEVERVRRFWGAPRMATREGSRRSRCSRPSRAARSRRSG